MLFALVRLAIFKVETDYPPETDNPSKNPSKLKEKQIDKIRRIVHPKLRPFHFSN